MGGSAGQPFDAPRAESPAVRPALAPALPARPPSAPPRGCPLLAAPPTPPSVPRVTVDDWPPHATENSIRLPTSLSNPIPLASTKANLARCRWTGPRPRRFVSLRPTLSLHLSAAP